jgi:hypothetical protein
MRTIQPGKTYTTRDGQRVRIEAETANRGTYRMQGEDEQGRITWRSRKGRFERHPHRLDLVAEVAR